MKYFQLLCFCLLLLCQKAAAQDVIVTVQVLPPYSTYLPDYLNNPSKIVFTLLSTQTRDVKIKATITGDNGIAVATSATGSAATPIRLVANQVKMLNGTALKTYLDVNSVAITGIDKNELYRGSGIPEGNYTLCLQVLDYQTNAPLSPPAPTGCSNPFTVMQINPPTLIAPTCDTEINATMPQNMVFTWLPAPGVAPGTQYKLKIVELVPNNRNANEAMNSATTPAFFETTTSAYSFFYGPAQPPLKNGKRYAWRVTALNSFNANARSNFQNNGHSEVRSFTYHQTVVASNGSASYGINLIKPGPGGKINSGYGMEFQWSASAKPNVASYELQFTNSHNQETKITNWDAIPEHLFSTMDAFMASKNVGKSLNEKLPGSWTNGKGKMAWRIRGMDANKKPVDSSRIGIYEIVEAPVTDRIKLITPTQGKKIVQGSGLRFEWESSKKTSVTEYEFQFTNIYEQDKPITNWNSLPEKLFDKKKMNYLSSKTMDLYRELSPSWTNGTGKIAWRVVGISYGFVVDSSKIETYEIIEDTSEMAKLKGFTIGGYYVAIKEISGKDPDKISGTGNLLLWENGKQVEVWFKDIKVRPFALLPKTQQKQWLAISGEINVEVYKKIYGNSRFMLQTASGCDGTLRIGLNSMKITANVQGSEGTDGLFRITNDLSSAQGMVVAKWFTNFFKPKAQQTSETNMYEIESVETPIKMTFADKFDGTIALKPQLFEEMGNGTISVNCGPSDQQLKVKGLSGELDLSGTVAVPNAAPINSNGAGFKNLDFAFKNKKNLNFAVRLDQPLKWQLNKDGSVWANVSEFYVHLSGTGDEDPKFKNYPDGINFDKFQMLVNLPKKAGQQTATAINLTFNNVYNNGKGYTNNKKGEVEIKDAVEIAGFPAKLKKSDFLLNKNKLAFLYVQGNIHVPFINDWSPIGLDIDSEKIQNVFIDFDYGKKYFLNRNGGQTYITLSAGRLENSSIVISPTMHIDNKKNEGVEFNSMALCDMYINPEGAVSFNQTFTANSESVCEGTKKWAKYFNFDFGVDKVKIKRNSVKTDAQFLFSGDLIMSEGIAVTSKKESGFLYHGKAPDPNANPAGTSINNSPYNLNNPVNTPPKIPKNIFGPASNGDYDLESETEVFEDTVEFTDDKKAIQGGYEDGGQKFGGGFKLVQNDPTWGDYFELGGYYEAKEPGVKQLEAKLILGKKKAVDRYSYWFFSFYQKGFAAVPIIPGIVEAHGFGGKAYYHMKVNYDNMGNISSMVPNNQYSLGISATADFRTSFDQGALLHGKATIVTQFYGFSLDGIEYYVNGSAIAPNSDSEGLLKARVNGQLNWVDKYIDGHGQMWGGIKKVVCVNEGAANEDAINFHFGADDFYINVGSKEAPITAEIMCGSGFTTGVWFNFTTNNLGFGFNKSYDSGWKNLNLGIGSAGGRLTADMWGDINMRYSPFQATGTAGFSGAAHGRGCLRVIGCIGGSVGVGANLLVTLPDPTEFSGSVYCNVSKWIPNFTLHAKWSSETGFSISL